MTEHAQILKQVRWIWATELRCPYMPKDRPQPLVFWTVHLQNIRIFHKLTHRISNKTVKNIISFLWKRKKPATIDQSYGLFFLMLLPVLVMLVTAWYTDISFFFLLTSYKSKWKVKMICRFFSLMRGKHILFYLRKQHQEPGLSMKTLSVLLQGKMSALHQKSLNSVSKSSILDWNLMDREDQNQQE